MIFGTGAKPAGIVFRESLSLGPREFQKLLLQGGAAPF